MAQAIRSLIRRFTFLERISVLVGQVLDKGRANSLTARSERRLKSALAAEAGVFDCAGNPHAVCRIGHNCCSMVGSVGTSVRRLRFCLNRDYNASIGAKAIPALQRQLYI